MNHLHIFHSTAGKTVSRPHPLQWLAAVILTLVLASGTGCDNHEAARSPSLPADHAFPLALGDTTVRVELALSDEERQRGLMFREALDENAGMLFVFERPRRLSFYMRNTSIPLDIGYFSSGGVLRELYPLYPHDETPVSSRGNHMQFALEMNQGWFAENEVRVGAALDLDALAEAIEKRGFSPEDFGL